MKNNISVLKQTDKEIESVFIKLPTLLTTYRSDLYAQLYNVLKLKSDKLNIDDDSFYKMFCKRFNKYIIDIHDGLKLIYSGRNDLYVHSYKTIEIIYWPILKCLDIKGKCFKDFGIDIDKLLNVWFLTFAKSTEIIYPSLTENGQHSDNIFLLKEYEFKDNKLYKVIYSSSLGVEIIYINNVLSEFKFCDESKLEVPKDL